MRNVAAEFETWLGKTRNRVVEKPYVVLSTLTMNGLNGSWSKWNCGEPQHPMPGELGPVDDLPGRLFDLSLTHDMLSWEFDQCGESILGITLHFIPSNDHANTITPEFIELLYGLVKEGGLG